MAEARVVMRSSKSYRIQKRVWRVLLYLILIALSLVFALPLLWTVSTSLKPDTQIMKFPPDWIPRPFDWSNYPDVFPLMNFLQSLKNSLIVAVSSVVGTLISCSVVAYSFARLRWFGRDFFFIVLLSTMMVPYAATMVPIFTIFFRVGLLDSFYPLIIPAFLGTPVYIFLLRQFFRTIPMDLADAAKIDGCSEFGIYWKVILPLAKPALAVVSIFTFINAWNDFLGPLIYLNSPEKYTMALALQSLRGAHYLDWAQLMAASTMMVLPILVLFFFTQRFFIEGVTLTGIKG